MIDRSLQRHVDVLEFLGTIGAAGGEVQATLEAYLYDTSPFQTLAHRAGSVEDGDIIERIGNDNG
ncbi:hypothetical protein ACC761_27590 [Rhizobium ruizarguesonis]|nr:hypothetical protein E0H67_25895 [Rhizobium leguminosarum bv. viciae]